MVLKWLIAICPLSVCLSRARQLSNTHLFPSQTCPPTKTSPFSLFHYTSKHALCFSLQVKCVWPNLPPQPFTLLFKAAEQGCSGFAFKCLPWRNAKQLLCVDLTSRATWAVVTHLFPADGHHWTDSNLNGLFKPDFPTFSQPAWDTALNTSAQHLELKHFII